MEYDDEEEYEGHPKGCTDNQLANQLYTAILNLGKYKDEFGNYLRKKGHGDTADLFPLVVPKKGFFRSLISRSKDPVPSSAQFLSMDCSDIENHIRIIKRFIYNDEALDANITRRYLKNAGEIFGGRKSKRRKNTKRSKTRKRRRSRS